MSFSLDYFCYILYFCAIKLCIVQFIFQKKKSHF